MGTLQDADRAPPGKGGRLIRLTLATAAGFAALTALVIFWPPLNQFDRAVSRRLHAVAASESRLTAVALLATELGSEAWLTAMTAVTAVILLCVRRRRLALAYVMVAIVSALFVSAVKETVARPRPSWPDPVMTESAYSFPSGHALGSTVGYGLLGYCLLTLRPHSVWRRRMLIGGLTAAVGVVSFTRVYLGVHYLSDVLGGIAAGLAWLGGGVTAVEALRWHRPPE